MEKKIKIAPSLLSCDFTKMGEQIEKLISSQADWLHFDVMDGVFVNNISFGLPIFKACQDFSIFKDVHLMIVNPHLYADRFIDDGADMITFHLEAYRFKKDVKALIKLIKSRNAFVGISIKPNTNVEEVIPYLPFIDMVLVMSVEPGFGGQSFLENSLSKISILRDYIDKNKLDCLIEVDGGINKDTAKLVIDAGVDVIVAGSYIFKGDITNNINELKR